jgi:phosphopantothenoylcysteine synthetase/decarboxylase
VAILAAAVADFTPEVKHDSKLKRGEQDLIIRLKPTADIAGSLGSAKKAKDRFLWALRWRLIMRWIMLLVS